MIAVVCKNKKIEPDDCMNANDFALLDRDERLYEKWNDERTDISLSRSVRINSEDTTRNYSLCYD